MEKIDSSDVVKGSRVLFCTRIGAYKNKEWGSGVQFELKWIRKLDSIEGKEKELCINP